MLRFLKQFTQKKTPATFAQAVTRTAIQLSARSTLTRGHAKEIEADIALASWVVLHEIVSRASLENLEKTTGLMEARELVDATFFLLALPAIAAEVGSSGTPIDPKQVVALQSEARRSAGVAETDRIMTTARTLAESLIARIKSNRPENQLVDRFLDALWRGVKAFAWTGKPELLGGLAALYLIFVRDIMVPLLTSKPAY
jgi:hypothetical protein